MSTKQTIQWYKQRITLLEDLINAQQELIMIYNPIIDLIDCADNAYVTTTDPYQETMIGKDLHDERDDHVEREAELLAEIAGYFDIIEGKQPEKKEDAPSD